MQRDCPGDADTGRTWLAENGFDRLMGARPMGRIIQKKVKEMLASV